MTSSRRPAPREASIRLAAHDATASRNLAAQELLQEIRRHLAPDERHLVDLRHQGLDWAAIAAGLGEGQVVLRKRALSRPGPRHARIRVGRGQL